MADTIIGENSVIEYSIIDENTVVGCGCKIGETCENDQKITVLGRNITVDDGSVVEIGAMIDKDVSKEGK